MASIEEIIATAKTKEKWSANHKFNYGPIDYLNDELVNKPKGLKATIEGLEEFKANVHRVTDAETYFVWQHCKYDIEVDADMLVVEMRMAFPDVPFKTVCKWINKYEEPHQYHNGISKSLVPKEILEECNIN